MPLSKCYDICVNVVKKYLPDLLGAEIFFHPYRFREEIKTQLRQYAEFHSEDIDYVHGGFWKLARADVLNLGSLHKYIYFSPHFHMLAFGYFTKSDDFSFVSGGWIYKNKRAVSLDIFCNPDRSHNDAVCQVVAYLLTHIGVELNDSGRAVKTHRSYGLMSSRYFRKSEGLSFSLYTTLLCPECVLSGKEIELELTDEELNPIYDTFYDYDSHCSVADSEPKRIRCITEISNYILSNPKPRVKGSSIKFASNPQPKLFKDYANNQGLVGGLE